MNDLFSQRNFKNIQFAFAEYRYIQLLAVFGEFLPVFIFLIYDTDFSGINALATLPSKEEIFSKLLYVINAPAQQLVTVMNAVGRNLAVVVDQGVKENKFSA